MRKEDVRNILSGVLTGNGEDARIVEWCKEHLSDVLDTVGVRRWQAPYYVQESEYTEDRTLTFGDNKSIVYAQHYVDVFDAKTKVCIGRVACGRGAMPVGEVIKRDDKWYLLVADSFVVLYSLPDLQLVAKTQVNYHTR